MVMSMTMRELVPMHTKATAAALAGALGLALVACGSNDGDKKTSSESTAVSATSASTTTAVRTSADFIAEVNTTLCKPMEAFREDQAAKAGLTELTGPPTVEQLQGLYAAVSPEYAKFVEAFAAVEPAPEDQAAFDTAVAELRKANDITARAGSDPALVQELIDTNEAALMPAQEALVALGLDPEC